MIKTDVKLPLSYSAEDIITAITERLPIKRDEILDTEILKRSLNVSDKKDIHYTATVGICLSVEREAGLLKMKKKVSLAEDMTLTIPRCRFDKRPIVVGSGPSGLFAALLLAEAGAKPILIERGLSVDERTKKVEIFTKLGILDPECNIQFGEGGAGTFSDGKLKVGGMDKYKHKILSEFVDAGAPDDIIYSVGAHVGTDKLQKIVQKIRQKIISLGGEVRFNTRLTSIKVNDGMVVSAFVNSGEETVEIDTDEIILATGHSARDVFVMLKNMGASLVAKGFGIGVRIEHPREYINDIVYGKNHPTELGAASYHLVTHLDCGRSVYSFCMCPGGTVVAAASEAGGIVTNGMSEYKRDAENSNAALLVSVTPDDFGSSDPLAGIELQRRIERAAFRSAGEKYAAPTISLGAFMNGEKASLGTVTPSYSAGTVLCSAEEYLPDIITNSLRKAMPDFDSWMPGYYYPDASLTGPETRTTSPVRVLRDEKFRAIGFSGLYPTGEGAGYAGGIVSSARDGLLVAEALIMKNRIE